MVVVCAASAACGDSADSAVEEPGGEPWFEECARERGIDFVHDCGHGGDLLLLPEIMCGGAALFDADGDGDLDAYLVQAGGIRAPRERRPPNRLYRNRGDGTFDDVTERSGAGDRGYGMGVATGDFDGDGDVDLYVTNVGPNTLLRNDGGGRFTDVTAEAGVGEPAWSSSAAFFDYDRDGDLDLYVVNYIRWSLDVERECTSPFGGPDYCSPRSYAAPAPDTLYRNDGGGRFTDVSEAAGIRRAFGNGLGVATADFDGDGREDVFVANDGTLNQLWRNLGDGTFEDRALLAGCAMDTQGVAKAGMGVVAADLDDDSDVDLLVQNLGGETDSFYRNDDGVFCDRTATAGLAATSRRFTRFGIGLHDYDVDGLVDLLVVAGRVTRSAAPLADDPFAEPNLLYRGVGPARFEEALPRGGTRRRLVFSSRGAAFGDVDGDGGVDALVVNRDAPAHLFRNVAPRRGHWVSLRVVERNGGDALGAVVTVDLGSRRITRGVHTATSYCSASDPRVHVGLGAVDRVDGVMVRWVDGSAEMFAIPAVDRVVTLRRGEGAPR